MCPDAPKDCSLGLPIYPCIYDASDVPFLFYPNFRNNPAAMRDLAALGSDIAASKLPQVSFVKGLGYHSEHPGGGTTISAGVSFVTSVVKLLQDSKYASKTLILLTYDEGGGYFDHVAPPAASTVDMQPYGTRIPLIAIGPFARRNFVSHVTLEHSSIVKFIEWNWLGGQTGQLGTRDAVVNNLGSLLDPALTGKAVPEK
jgi:phospholipase C